MSASESRWMALDVGSKTIGLAITDPLKVTVRPLGTLQRQNPSYDCRKVLETAALHHVSKLIVGRPLHLDGRRSDILSVIEALAGEITRWSDISIEWMDERLSSKEAEVLMAEAGVDIRDRRRRRNEFAAAVILRRFLEEMR
ncbi:MAG: Holliday junction resolvase RuvX [Acidobacteriota bacterium]